jgi:NitT/TauT family transport system permease protein
VSSPLAASKALVSLIQEGVLPTAFQQSLVEWAVGLGIGVGGGLVVGVLMGEFKLVEFALNPFVNFLYATPRVALLPLLVVWLGLGTLSQTVFVILTCTFPMLLNSIAGVRNVNQGYRDVAACFGVRGLQSIVKISIPGAVPYLMVGFRISASLGLVGVIIAQLEVSVSGLGSLLVNYGRAFQTPELMAVLFVTALFGVVIAVFMWAMERWAVPWVREARAIQ